jgi:hypothetical protein
LTTPAKRWRSSGRWSSTSTPLSWRASFESLELCAVLGKENEETTQKLSNKSPTHM